MPQLLADIPAGKNAIQGPHHRIAATIATLIRSCNGGQSIRLDGNWGVGKSTVVRLLAHEFESQQANPPGANDPDVVVFEYDAWVHTGDPLRRAFFEALVAKLRGRWIPDLQSHDEADEWTERIEFLAKRLKKTSKHSELVFNDSDQTIITSLLCVGLVAPLLNSAISSLAQGKGFFASVAWAAVLGFGAYKLLRPLTGRTLSLFLRRQPDRETVTVTEAGEPTSLEFQSAFLALLGSVLGNPARPNRKLVIVVDNLDRVDAAEVQATWALLRSFLDNPTFRKEPWYERLWLLVPMARADKVNPESAGSERDQASALEKVFQVRFTVPDMTTHFWRSFFEDRMAIAFDKLNRKSRNTVIDLYAEDLDASKLTPRAIISFINSLVALYVERGLQEEQEGSGKDAISIEVLAAYLLWERGLNADGTALDVADYMKRLTGRDNLESTFNVIRLGVPDRKHIGYINAQQNLAEIFSGELTNEALDLRLRNVEAFIDDTLNADRELRRFAVHECTAFPGPLAAFAQTARTFIDQKRSADEALNQVFEDILITLGDNAMRAVSELESLPLADESAIKSITTALSSFAQPESIAQEICRKLEAPDVTSSGLIAPNMIVAPRVLSGIVRLLSNTVVADAILDLPRQLTLPLSSDFYAALVKSLNETEDHRYVLENCTCRGGDRELSRFLINSADALQWNKESRYILHLLGQRDHDAFGKVSTAVVDQFRKASGDNYQRTIECVTLLGALVRANPELAKPLIRPLAEAGYLTKFIALSTQLSGDKSVRFTAAWLVLWSWNDGVANGSFQGKTENQGLRHIRDWLTDAATLEETDIDSMCDALVNLTLFETLNGLTDHIAFVHRILDRLPSTFQFKYHLSYDECSKQEQAERFAAERFANESLRAYFLESYSRHQRDKSTNVADREDSAQVE
ncbi:hypothetical protein WL48_34990 [Burkholderia ubonensis]|uniref:P-loop NTPase fold protein n=1 Tax=Burkholderia ubonensis TaxID=101571 RepID=UPI000753BB90|nr:P-loop NTPase fold protein [Burkholderia ubonensis]KWC21050.1 hypothetical protein WL48_34990 [Burkholderia ubonensis]KWC36892.1 hypothetical protein WL49_20985 [Burkholderia ubonensis]